MSAHNEYHLLCKGGDRRNRPPLTAETEGGTGAPQPRASPVAEDQPERRQDGGTPFVAAKEDRETHGAGTSGSCRCSPHPKGGNGRNLVVCIDGTSNQFSEKNTNVVELYKSLIKDDEQLTYYDSGIGTYVSDDANRFSRWKQAIKHKGDMMFAWSFKKNVLNAYQWLSENYQDGDKIFLFGAQCKVVGLLHKGNNNQIQFAYQLYLSTTSKQRRPDQELPSRTRKGKNPKTTKKQDDLCARFKETLSRKDVRVHFVGAWDTVSSIGTARGPSLPETTTGMKHVCFFRHGLALDEKRGKFLPELANGGDDNLKGGDSKGNVKEVWFAGSHSDIGGGIVHNPDANHFGPALRWMKYEGMTNGLRVSPQTDQWKPLELNLSVGLFYKIIDLLPYRRLSYKDRESTIRWPPHRGAARQVKPGQKIHQSVFNSMGINTETVASAQRMQRTEYRPLARLPDGHTWEKWHALLEPDPYLSAVTTIAELQEVSAEKTPLSTPHRDILEGLIHSETGRVSLATAPHAGRVLFQTLEHSQDDAISCEVLAAAITAVGPDANTEYSGRLPRDLHIASIGMSRDGPTVRIWDVQTGVKVAGSTRSQYFGPYEGLSTGGYVAFSPDGMRVASCPEGKTIHIWDARTGETVAGPFTGRRHGVRSLAFSPDGTRIVAGTDDNAICIWDVQTGETVAGPFTGRTYSAHAVAFSPDGTRIVSASDRAFRIWNAQTAEPVAGPFEFMPFNPWLKSIAFTPDGTRVASGVSHNNAICIWDAQTGEKVAGGGHTDRVQHIAFSPDGTRIVSGSWDSTIRIWDTRTGETVVGPLRGHTKRVYSVAYSPDGKLVASGSLDGTVRIWDAEVY
ncbi:hypothetical protein FA95DRAFT_1531655 [Auriscalpium vulgare]|uniref:Uncharacterized protein n=1 Tax=Auriscalpium vulgare TaxID=40419 RepID=A0ACB8S9T4_9AGAM|nr:hypothetical protein FA95DRAFT_1531655 [Auriscalpium vulgare]